MAHRAASRATSAAGAAVRSVVTRVRLAELERLIDASNAKAKRELGWTLRYPSWRQGFTAADASPNHLRPPPDRGNGPGAHTVPHPAHTGRATTTVSGAVVIASRKGTGSMPGQATDHPDLQGRQPARA